MGGHFLQPAGSCNTRKPASCRWTGFAASWRSRHGSAKQDHPTCCARWKPSWRGTRCSATRRAFSTAAAPSPCCAWESGFRFRTGRSSRHSIGNCIEGGIGGPPPTSSTIQRYCSTYATCGTRPGVATNAGSTSPRSCSPPCCATCATGRPACPRRPDPRSASVRAAHRTTLPCGIRTLPHRSSNDASSPPCTPCTTPRASGVPVRCSSKPSSGDAICSRRSSPSSAPRRSPTSA